jgi:hypothetical protein
LVTSEEAVFNNTVHIIILLFCYLFFPNKKFINKSQRYIDWGKEYSLYHLTNFLEPPTERFINSKMYKHIREKGTPSGRFHTTTPFSLFPFAGKAKLSKMISSAI